MELVQDNNYPTPPRKSGLRSATSSRLRTADSNVESSMHGMSGMDGNDSEFVDAMEEPLNDASSGQLSPEPRGVLIARSSTSTACLTARESQTTNATSRNTPQPDVNFTEHLELAAVGAPAQAQWDAGRAIFGTPRDAPEMNPAQAQLATGSGRNT